MARRTVGAVDLGGTKILAAVIDDTGAILGECRANTDTAAGSEGIADGMMAALRSAAESANVTVPMLAALGITVPGPIDPVKQIVGNPPNLPGWHDVPLGAMMRERSGLEIVMENDANAAALGEQAFGAGKGVAHMVYVTVSTGIGGGVVTNGRLVGGAHGAAGEIGHMIILADGPECGCGRKGCLEALASGTAIAREAAAAIKGRRAPDLAKRANGVDVTAEMVGMAAQAGDVVAQKILADAARYLGIGLMNVVHLLDPELIVVGGGVSKSEHLLLPAAEYVRENAFPVMLQGLRILPAALGDRSGVMGAAALALRQGS